jgi:hypothetical protein
MKPNDLVQGTLSLLLANAIRSEINRLDPSLAAGRIETVRQVLENSLSAERFRTGLLVCLAIAALPWERTAVLSYSWYSLVVCTCRGQVSRPAW